MLHHWFDGDEEGAVLVSQVLIEAAFCLLNYYVALKAGARNMEVESGDWGVGC